MDKKEIKAAVARRRKEERVAMPQPKALKAREALSLDFIAACYDTNNVGEARLYVALNQSRHRFDVNAGRWFFFKDHFWDVDYLGAEAFSAIAGVVAEFERYYEAVLLPKIEYLQEKDHPKPAEVLNKEYKNRIKRLLSAGGRADVINTVLKETAIHCTSDQFNQNGWLLPVNNGVIDLRTGHIRDGRPDDFCSVHAPVDWDGIDSPAPVWEAFLFDIFAGNLDMINYIKRILGMAIVGQQLEPDFFLLYGKHGRNGKTTLLETIAKVLGPELTGAIPVEFFLRQKFGGGRADQATPTLVSMQGKRIVWGVEPDENREYAIGQLKAITGGDSITARQLHEKNITFTPSLTLFLLSNHLPHASANDGAFWERMRPLELTLSFVIRQKKIDEDGNEIERSLQEFQWHADTSLRDKLAAEHSGILASLVRYCLDWQDAGSTSPPAKVIKFLDQYRASEDILQSFLDENCFVDIGNPNCSSSLGALYKKYKTWWKNNNPSKELSKRRFSALLEDKFEKFKNSTIFFRGVTLDDGKMIGDAYEQQ
ncbi:hypothetical protein JWG39_13705 [Desulforhopalus vacuolatus]|uniref:DNA primase family protein n=1 Tax=Desulforhopalus vacuolatus TaxID=40414 RepID=UPI001962F735|nr:phage/plasmid primase, P4 family [Desulforhopalus vacuolatus]MBM9520871.1 hypothetical protein [Desulforhopalus vacuolatus]